MRLLGHMVAFSKDFQGASILCCIAAAPFCIPTNSVQGLQFLYILANVYYLLFFVLAILTGVG